MVRSCSLTVSCFTPLIEALTLQINALYHALSVKVERYGGSVIRFAGDWITC
jgi:hypothetical protein